MKKLTIFTPTYNRRILIERVYSSLKKQTNKNFIWLIVDDGSTDGTKEYINKIKEEKKIETQYIYQRNLGKMQAHNTGVINCETEYFVCLDSDDIFVNSAVESILTNIDRTQKENCVGIIAYKCVTKQKKDLLGVFPNVEYTTLNDVYDKGYIGETTLVFKTNIIKQYLFPRFNHEKFITEAYIYDRIDRKYCYYILPEILIIYEYQENGLSNSIYKIISNNPIGYMEYWKQKFNFSYEDRNVKKVIKHCINYICFSLNAKVYFLETHNFLQLFLIILLYPVGFFKYFIISKKGGV